MAKQNITMAIKALDTARATLDDIRHRESKSSFHGQRVASDCDAAIKVIDLVLTATEVTELTGGLTE